MGREAQAFGLHVFYKTGFVRVVKYLFFQLLVGFTGKFRDVNTSLHYTDKVLS